MDDKQTVSHSYGTPLKRYASFNESRTGKTTPSFGRYKSESDITPKNEFIVKTQNITPMINYNQLDTPSIVKELSKFGLKPLKRKRGVNLLKHIYEATHPIVESNRENSDADKKILKKWKNSKGENVSQNSESISDNQFQKCHLIEPWEETISESDLIFERQRSSKIPGCRIPLQIVWHNFLVQNPEIRENILLYEPLQVNVISSMLKEEGFKFHIQDLITFLDQKCITIKI
ncbi:hypothetical protein WA026_013763 [Henosepilachna vigintioctopunctata]|uniref:Structure-specific endonuclease subunit SLX4 n=1 Tax=Henosepilachna vigintioctopunctata TaxID=420089 RepID=A0AAW1UZG4_9CUCU